MPETTPSAWLASTLNVLRSVPAWLFVGAAIACAAVLLLPAFAGIAPDKLAAVRAQWGVWAWVLMIFMAILGIARLVDAGIEVIREQRRDARLRKALVFIPQMHSWWSIAKQPDDTYVSQIALRVDCSNRTNQPVRVVGVKLIYPRARRGVLTASVTLPNHNNLHSSMHPVPPRDSAVASIHIMVRGKLGREGRTLCVGVELTDQAGEKYRIAGIQLGSQNQIPAKLSVKARITNAWQYHLRRRSEAIAPLPVIWAHEGRFNGIDLILNEEKRSYVANGRNQGGLGSLNVTLQSEPNNGWTVVGAIPVLLWKEEERPPTIDSENLVRLMRVHTDHNEAERREIEEYLLSHLDKRSRYAPVAYFVFLALHRMGRTVDALRTAQAQLAGDKIFAYSNLLGTLSGLVSREHFATDPALYDALTNLLENDSEYNFRVIEKMNLARLQHMDNGGGKSDW